MSLLEEELHDSGRRTNDGLEDSKVRAEDILRALGGRDARGFVEVEDFAGSTLDAAAEDNGGSSATRSVSSALGLYRSRKVRVWFRMSLATVESSGSFRSGTGGGGGGTAEDEGNVEDTSRETCDEAGSSMGSTHLAHSSSETSGRPEWEDWPSFELVPVTAEVEPRIWVLKRISPAAADNRGKCGGGCCC